MTQYNFEGNIEGLSERQLEFINDVIIENGFKDSKVNFEPVGKAGDNYVADVKRITIEGENGTLKLIAKVAPSNESLRMATNALMLFKNEHIMYTKVLPKLVQLQKDADVPESEQLRYAKCYGSLTETMNEVILLEDLNTSDFIMLDRFESLSNECVLSILQNFSKLHSLSFVLKAKDIETYNDFKSQLMDMWSAMEGVGMIGQHFQQLESYAIDILDDPEHKNIVRHKVVDSLKLAVKLAKLDEGNKYAIIQQGDAWTNNIMFRFEEGKLKESVMIDYQLSNHKCPVYDLMYMIFNCTDHETRSQHYYDWLDYYHKELDNSLSMFGLKANFVYPRDQLDADLKRYAKLIFGFSIVLAGVLTAKSEEASKMRDAMENMVGDKEIDVYIYGEETTTRFRKRVVGLIDSFKLFGLL